ncbi:hypothetical protein K492DRAFT_235191 [Lichtheimia hyalospora FSU 10163]|nr:hypothetical protein K492DRAFT_235191 [Lichtheimia hyalospora FSU 10163]
MDSPSPRSIQALDQATVRNLHSGQAIIDIETIVKELVENALDANASSIDIKLVNKGLKLIQASHWVVVKDNGIGIREGDRPSMAVRYCTSKISTFQDIEKLTTLGFRGEALNSINDIADSMQITTKTIHDTIAKEYQFDQSGRVQSEKPSAVIPKSGTMVAVHDPFSNLPVRRQVAQKGAVTAAKKVQELIIKYSIAYPNVRFALVQVSDSVTHKKEPSWIKPTTSTLLEAVAYIFGTRLASMLEYCTCADDTVTLECLLPKATSDSSIVNKGDRTYVFVNKRPINYARSELKEMVSIIKKRYQQAFGLSDDIQLNADQYDVNVEPSKTAVMLHHKENIINLVTELMDQVYGVPIDRLLDRASSNQPSSNMALLYRDQSVGAESCNQPSSPDSCELDELIESPDIDVSSSSDAIVPIQTITSPGDKESSNNGDHPQVDSDEDDALKSSGNWKYNMFSQDSNNDDDEEDQLLPDDEEETTNESRRVPTLSTWLESSREHQSTAPTSSIVAKEQHMTMQPASNHINHHIPKPIRLRASSVESHPSQCQHDQSMQPEHHQRGQSVPPFISNEMDWQLERSSARNTIPTTISSSQSHQWVSSHIFTSHSLERPPSSTTTKRKPSRAQQPTLYDMFRPHPPCAEKQSHSNITSPSIRKTSSISPNPSHQHTQVTPISGIDQVPTTLIASHPSSQPTTHPPNIIPDMSNFTPLSRGSPSASDMMRKRQRRINLNDEQQKHGQILTDTLNMDSDVLCSKEKILKTYRIRFAGLSGLDHRSFSDPPLFSSQPSDQDTDWHIYHLDQGLVLYTRNAKHHGELGDVAYEIGIVDLARASTLYAFHCLMKNKKLIAKRGSEKTIQVTISEEDPVYCTIPELKSYDKHGVDEDGQSRLYHRVIDDRVTANGFQIQWRREQHTAEIVLQIICIYDLGSTIKYDVSDLRELLLAIGHHRSDYNEEQQDFSMMRPKKVIAYFHRVAALPQAPERQASILKLSSIFSATSLIV